jgi:hypothetical protein
MDDILEKEFNISYEMKIPFNYDDSEYYEFVWRYERLVEQRKRENDAENVKQGEMSLANLSPDLLTKFNMRDSNGTER